MLQHLQESLDLKRKIISINFVMTQFRLYNLNCILQDFVIQNVSILYIFETEVKVFRLYFPNHIFTSFGQSRSKVLVFPWTFREHTKRSMNYIIRIGVLLKIDRAHEKRVGWRRTYIISPHDPGIWNTWDYPSPFEICATRLTLSGHYHKKKIYFLGSLINWCIWSVI